jgi:hypothetical protein
MVSGGHLLGAWQPEIIDPEGSGLNEEGIHQRDRAASILVAEYGFVANTILFYRRLEVTALAGTGLLLSAVIAALAAMESAESPDETAEAILLSAGAWVPAFLLLFQIVALTRLQRNWLYLGKLDELARRITGEEEITMWNRWPSPSSVIATSYGRVLASDKLVRIFVSSSPIIASIALASVGLAVVGVIIDPSVLTLALGIPGAVVSVALAIYGIAFALAFESDKPIQEGEVK